MRKRESKEKVKVTNLLLLLLLYLVVEKTQPKLKRDFHIFSFAHGEIESRLLSSCWIYCSQFIIKREKSCI